MGYQNFRLIPLDQADLLEFKWVKTLFKVAPDSDNKLVLYSKTLKAVKFFLKKAKFLEDIQTAEGIFRAYERNQGDTTRTVNKLLKQLDETNTLKKLRDFRKVIKDTFNEIDIDKTLDPLKVHISGEIHISLEPYVNLEIRRKLGEMGVLVEQCLSLYDWIVHKFHLNYHRKWLEHLAMPWVPLDIGGECVWVIGEYIDAAKRNIQGFAHIYPFTCMPEITARTIITNALKKKYDLPVIFFSFDEQSGMEGFRTRLEAFVDLMQARRNKEIKDRQNSKNHVKTDLNEYCCVNNFSRECLNLIYQIK
ncbi:MAG: hypothetical protein ACFFAN_12970 [Promethearchaeota archaeon]